MMVVGGSTNGGWRVTEGGWRVSDGVWRITLSILLRQCDKGIGPLSISPFRTAEVWADLEHPLLCQRLPSTQPTECNGMQRNQLLRKGGGIGHVRKCSRGGAIAALVRCAGL